MKKRVLLIFFIILLLVSNVCAYSFTEFLGDFNEFVTGKVVGKRVIEDVDKCETKYLEGYECSADGTKLLKGYQNRDCSVSYVHYRDCGFGCSGGRCKENVVEKVVSSPDVVEGGLGSIPVTEEIVEDEVPQPVVYGYLNVATLKQNYLVGEQVNLTDPLWKKRKDFLGNWLRI